MSETTIGHGLFHDRQCVLWHGICLKAIKSCGGPILKNSNVVTQLHTELDGPPQRFFGAMIGETGPAPFLASQIYSKIGYLQVICPNMVFVRPNVRMADRALQRRGAQAPRAFSARTFAACLRGGTAPESDRFRGCRRIMGSESPPAVVVPPLSAVRAWRADRCIVSWPVGRGVRWARPDRR